MSEYVFHLGEFNGSDMLEFQHKKQPVSEKKFWNPDSLYVEDAAFYFFLEDIFKEVVPDFDMFEHTVVEKSQWKEIMQLDHSKWAGNIDAQTITDTMNEINEWVKHFIPDDEAFFVLGV